MGSDMAISAQNKAKQANRKRGGRGERRRMVLGESFCTAFSKNKHTHTEKEKRKPLEQNREMELYGYGESELLLRCRRRRRRLL